MKGIELLGLLAKAKKVRVSQYTDYKFTCPMGATFAELQFGTREVVGGVKRIHQKSDLLKFKVDALEKKYNVIANEFDSNVRDLSEGWHDFDYARQIELKPLVSYSLQKEEMKLLDNKAIDLSNCFSVLNMVKSTLDYEESVSMKEDPKRFFDIFDSSIYNAAIYSNGTTHHVCVTKEDKVNDKPVICKHKILSFKGCTLAQLKNWLQTKEGYDEVRANLYQKGYTYKTKKI